MEELQRAEGWAIARKTENIGFTCARCGARVDPLPTGSYRNHCPNCLWSVHVDNVPGDRASSCRGPTRPIGVDFRAAKGFVVMHRCQKCGTERRNKAAPDDTDALIALMRALAASRHGKPDRWLDRKTARRPYAGTARRCQDMHVVGEEPAAHSPRA